MITIIVDDQVYLLQENALRQVVMAIIPEFLRDSKAPEPDQIGGLMRQAIKSAAVMPTGFGKPNVLQTVLFEVYGANAPKFDKKADKLPIIWNALTDWIVKKAASEELYIHAEPDAEAPTNVHHIKSATTESLHLRQAARDYQQAQAARDSAVDSSACSECE